MSGEKAIAIVYLLVVAAAVGWLIGRSMLYREQAVRDLSVRLYGLEAQVAATPGSPAHLQAKTMKEKIG